MRASEQQIEAVYKVLKKKKESDNATIDRPKVNQEQSVEGMANNDFEW